MYKMNEDSLSTVDKMIDYFYTGNYDVEPTAQIGQARNLSVLQTHARVFALADKYHVDALLLLSVAHYSNRLQDADIIEFLDSVPDVYQLTPDSIRQLRDKAVKYARFNLAKHIVYASVKRAYDNVANTTPDFIKDLLDLYMEAPLVGKCWNCGPCQALETVQSRCLQCGKDTSLPTC